MVTETGNEGAPVKSKALEVLLNLVANCLFQTDLPAVRLDVRKNR